MDAGSANGGRIPAEQVSPVAPPAGARAGGWTFFKDVVPASSRVCIVASMVLGAVLGAYCFWVALTRESPYWLALAVLQVAASMLSLKDPMTPAGVTVKGKRLSKVPHVYSWEFFVFASLFCFSPEVAAAVGVCDAVASTFAGLVRLRVDRLIFNMASVTLWIYPSGKLFYWLIGQSPPLNAAEAPGGALILAAAALCGALHWLINIASLGFLTRDKIKPGLLRFIWSRASYCPLAAAAATAAAAVTLILRDGALLGVLLAAPVILIALSYSRAYNLRVHALIESRKFLHSSLDALSSNIAVLDGGGRVVAANQAWVQAGRLQRLFGDWIPVGANYLEACRGSLRQKIDAAEAVAQGVQRVISGELADFTLDYSCAPVEPDAWYVVRVSRFRIPEPLRVVVEHQDITDQMLSDARLRESEARYRQFFEDDLTGDFVADGQGRLIDCNPAFARIFGFESAAQAVGSDLNLLFPEADAAGRLIEALRQHDRLEYREMDLRALSGATIHVVANLSARFDPSGRLLQVEGYLFDDTLRKRLELELAEAQKMEAVGQLAGGIAHDFNNLLTVVTGYGEFLFESLSGHRRLSQKAVWILDAAQHAGALTSKLLAFSRRQVVRPTVLDLNRTVAEISLMLRQLIGEDIELSTHLAARRATVRVDPSHLEQIILNLALNSRDAMPGGGVLRLETGDAESVAGEGGPGREGTLCLRVIDSGAGMTAEVRRRAFEPFFTTKEKGKGTGLGLSTVYGIVQQLGGRIELHSEPGAGTCVEIHLPRVAAEGAEATAAAPGDSEASGSETILVVEDEADIRRLIGSVLSARGYRVLDAGDGVEAIQLLERTEAPVHLLLTDMAMPRMGGWELARAVRGKSRHASVKVLFISGYPDEKRALEEAVADGRGDYLPKPFTTETLLTKVREALDS